MFVVFEVMKQYIKQGCNFYKMKSTYVNSGDNCIWLQGLLGFFKFFSVLSKLFFKKQCLCLAYCSEKSVEQ